MNILKKSLAPITDEAWDEIKAEAKKVFKASLTAREFVDIDGPNGMDYSAVPTGKVITPKNQSKNGVNYGVRQVLPLIEARKPFTLDLWELDNLSRGAKAVNMDPLVDAAAEIAHFEEDVIYNGFKQGESEGLIHGSEHPPVKTPENPDEFLKEVAQQVIQLKKSYVNGPYTLIVSEKIWKNLVKLTEGYPFTKQLKNIINGKIIVNHNLGHSLLVSEQGGDYELVIGQDLSIGYDSHDTEKVKLYFTESFTFRILSPEAIVVFN
ncbi:MAG: bacteriocin family protein [Bacteroidetes bacterium]|nr:bacteriocin family protein [Bacteroidota bacterium]